MPFCLAALVIASLLYGCGGDNGGSSTFFYTLPDPPSTAAANPFVYALTNTTLSLTWDMPEKKSSASAYRIYRDGAAVADVANGVTYTDTGLMPGEKYCYSVAAVSYHATEYEQSPSTCAVAMDDAPSYVRVSGAITYDRVPQDKDAGLLYGMTTPVPVRGALVAVLRDSDHAQIAATSTDAAGNYSAGVPANTSVIVRVRAHAFQDGTPSYDFKVADNTSGKAVYVMDGSPFGTGIANISGRDYHAASGWTAAGYVQPRAAAPFAILDTIYAATMKVISADPAARMPQLIANWSVKNRPTSGSQSLGFIGTSYYMPSQGQLYLLGAAGVDTEEYDSHVVAHEWGHYLEHSLSRSDSLGGSHGYGDRLDPRVAFSEGLAYALAGMVLDSKDSIDTMGAGQSRVGTYFDLEDNDQDPHPKGWYSETTIMSLIYDLYDSADDGADILTLGFGPIYETLTGDMKSTAAMTTIHTFAYSIKSRQPGAQSAINALLTYEGISSGIADIWDSTHTEGNNGGMSEALPLYARLVAGEPEVTVCGTDAAGIYNKLGNRRFFYFTVSSDGNYFIRAESTKATADPDMVLYKNGGLVEVSEAPGGPEVMAATLSAGTYTGELYDWKHTDGRFYPSGSTCMKLSLY